MTAAGACQGGSGGCRSRCGVPRPMAAAGRQQQRHGSARGAIRAAAALLMIMALTGGWQQAVAIDLPAGKSSAKLLLAQVRGRGRDGDRTSVWTWLLAAAWLLRLCAPMCSRVAGRHHGLWCALTPHVSKLGHAVMGGRSDGGGQMVAAPRTWRWHLAGRWRWEYMCRG